MWDEVWGCGVYIGGDVGEEEGEEMGGGRLDGESNGAVFCDFLYGSFVLKYRGVKNESNASVAARTFFGGAAGEDFVVWVIGFKSCNLGSSEFAYFCEAQNCCAGVAHCFCEGVEKWSF